MKCMNNCGTELTGRQKTYCSDKCRKQAERQNNTSPEAAQSSNSDKSDTIAPPKSDKSKSDTPYERKLGQTVYSRRTVSYDGDKYETRPEPLAGTDTPCPRNRGRYTRLDGTQYQFDVIGQVFELMDGLVYQTVQDVMVAHAERKPQPTTAAPVDAVTATVEITAEPMYKA